MRKPKTSEVCDMDHIPTVEPIFPTSKRRSSCKESSVKKIRCDSESEESPLPSPVFDKKIRNKRRYPTRTISELGQSDFMTTKTTANTMKPKINNSENEPEFILCDVARKEKQQNEEQQKQRQQRQQIGKIASQTLYKKKEKVSGNSSIVENNKKNHEQIDHERGKDQKEILQFRKFVESDQNVNGESFTLKKLQRKISKQVKVSKEIEENAKAKLINVDSPVPNRKNKDFSPNNDKREVFDEASKIKISTSVTYDAKKINIKKKCKENTSNASKKKSFQHIDTERMEKESILANNELSIKSKGDHNFQTDASCDAYQSGCELGLQKNIRHGKATTSKKNVSKSTEPQKTKVEIKRKTSLTTSKNRLCVLCQSCSCASVTKTNEIKDGKNAISDVGTLLNASDAEIEKRLISRLKQLDKNVGWYQQLRNKASRELKKHRSAVMQNLLKDENFNYGNRKEKSRFLADVEIEEEFYDLLSGSLPVEDDLVEDTKEQLFGIQPTLTQMFGKNKLDSDEINQIKNIENCGSDKQDDTFGKKKINDSDDESSSSDHDYFMQFFGTKYIPSKNENAEHLQKRYSGEEMEISNKVIRVAHNGLLDISYSHPDKFSTNHVKIGMEIDQKNSEGNNKNERKDENRENKIDAVFNIEKSGGDSRKDDSRIKKSESSVLSESTQDNLETVVTQAVLSSLERIKKCDEVSSIGDNAGFNQLLNLFQNLTQLVGNRNENLVEESKMKTNCSKKDDDHKTDNLSQDNQDYLKSQLTPRGQAFIQEIEKTFENDPKKLSAILKLCPNWKESVTYAQRRTDLDGLEDALRNVKHCIDKINIMELQVHQCCQSQKYVLELFEESLGDAIERNKANKGNQNTDFTFENRDDSKCIGVDSDGNDFNDKSIDGANVNNSKGCFQKNTNNSIIELSDDEISSLPPCHSNEDDNMITQPLSQEFQNFETLFDNNKNIDDKSDHQNSSQIFGEFCLKNEETSEICNKDYHDIRILNKSMPDYGGMTTNELNRLMLDFGFAPKSRPEMISRLTQIYNQQNNEKFEFEKDALVEKNEDVIPNFAEMGIDELKRLMARHGFKHASKQQMIKRLNEIHMVIQHSQNSTSSMSNQNKKAIPKSKKTGADTNLNKENTLPKNKSTNDCNFDKKQMSESDIDILYKRCGEALRDNKEVRIKILEHQSVQLTEIKDVLIRAGVYISKVQLIDYLDDQGIGFVYR